MSVKNVKILRF